MVEFDLGRFGKELQTKIASAIPFPTDVKRDEQKHKNRNPRHLKEEVTTEFLSNYEILNGNQQAFNLGSERLETIYPHYHILEDAEVIHKAGLSTETSRGSQARLQEKHRDYGAIVMKYNKNSGKWNMSQEYRKNVRGKRSALKKATVKVVKDNGVVEEREVVVGTKSATTYPNVHYHYIERALDTRIVNELAIMFNLQVKRKKITDILDNNEDFMLKVFDL